MSLRALIFDLDDTLIDTHGQLVYQAHWQACLAMHAAGLQISPAELMQTRQNLLLQHPRAEINALLAAHYQCQSQAVIQAGFETYFNPHLTELDLFPGTRALLENWAQNYALFLVTSGYEKTQKRKVELLKIAPFFQGIHFVDIKDKNGKYKAFYELQTSLGGENHEFAVIGDRINNEIVAGNQLGMTTVWIRHGECAHILPQNKLEEPDFTLNHVRELPEILAQPLSKQSH
ncbi:hypothetical protein COW36_12285 [bacterium (Candidatus Blackallbacteria) CG17_big_fil_post_rev_8_21_14_2_50_48_46]|uniref:HAD family hydrolase n=1 Tax=bacterium (Candidatus Blackallbacteria) CG17_big_fil_post_rev_8_21_14_2_50_48_46 TaxID=2014261 RepID=A0A2M7G3S2_9BACT|nr:MAG: hypothetical protein COW64_02975 [bacterium (Candidatus Blackallbacteria) CG18_big_fil_WC_8_21_14_2_50_49_26]PIW16538.1 MAG: hypothetical protein COW36_12285 [bacterium (Candidatus Blackallbacteria) CG17_big_fil_post_rev_8_21_14_2_50_48_46]PIW46046.1 MAG: hypothetical protein COW20_17550 [bacterium (Candidatus Blackallbacteria) CG13_big_fil_rev_8_21_14_2_50_49_14]